ncbi:MAG: cobalamin-dependent protein, partial [Gammaproteobacteria bacterium]|nr:cobalamin-dependent protein [Gammaproteobacteria bacterium]
MAAPSSRITPRADADLPIRFVTAAGLFDGHDSSINIVRRLLQAAGCEVVHLGHNRAVEEIVTAALQEDVHGVAVSSYQGGHLEYFRYLIDRLRARGGGHVQVFGGGGGVIVPQEIRELETYGVARIYSPRDGQQLGLKGMVEDMLTRCRSLDPVEPGDSVDFWLPLARRISQLEAGGEALPSSRPAAVPVLGITGTGGAGKSSLTDELIRRFRQDYGDALRIAVLAVDPTRRRSGGALLGDRIRMNSLAGERIYFRSLATRDAGTELPRRFEEILAATRASGFDLVIIETPGIGQGDAGIVPFADVALYVMTPEFGAASQLEKIDMLDFADAVAINKFDRQGGSDALRDVAKQLQRNREAFHSDPAQMPVFGTIAARFNDDGVTALYRALQTQLVAKGLRDGPARLADVDTRCSTRIEVIVPTARRRYLAEIAEAVRGYHAETLAQARIARERGALALSRELLADRGADTGALAEAEAERERALSASCRELLAEWPAIRERYAAEEMEHAGERVPLRIETLSGTRMSRLALPRFTDPGDLLAWL